MPPARRAKSPRSPARRPRSRPPKISSRRRRQRLVLRADRRRCCRRPASCSHYLAGRQSAALGRDGLASACYAQGAASCASSALSAALTITPTWEAARFLARALATRRRAAAGPAGEGAGDVDGPRPPTSTTARPLLPLHVSRAGGAAGWYKFGIFYDLFAPCITILNLSGYALSTFLYFKGLYFRRRATRGRRARCSRTSWGNSSPACSGGRSTSSAGSTAASR